jgi:Uncharacterized proteins involved in stress response, homologs of TerZ and putative cAMP-binding protein CABP1
MKTLPKGGNAPLSSAGGVRVELCWPSGCDSLDPVCLAVGADGRIPSEDWFVFYNQPQAPGGVVALSMPSSGRAEIRMQLERLPGVIDRLVIAAALAQGSFRDLIGARLTAAPAAGEPLVFELTEAEDEQALILAELYRHAGGWKLRAVGQGFRGGLQTLAEHFGVTVADAGPWGETSAPPSSDLRLDPPTPPPPIPLESTPPPRRRPRRLIWSLTLLILLIAAVGALWSFRPDWRALPDALWTRLHDHLLDRAPPTVLLDAPQPPPPAGAETEAGPPRSRPSALSYQAPTCPWGDPQVF